MGMASWVSLIKMTIVKLISFDDLNLKKKKKMKKKKKKKKKRKKENHVP